MLFGVQAVPWWLPACLSAVLWQALERFRQQEDDFLIATDVAARVSGLDSQDTVPPQVLLAFL